MTLSKQATLLGIENAQISKMANVQNETYDTAIDVSGIQNISLLNNYIAKPLYKDEKVKDYYSQIDSINWAFSNVKVSLEVLAVLEGGDLNPLEGTTPNQYYNYTLSSSSAPNYFKLEGQIKYTSGEVGDYHMVLYKCKVGSLQVEYKCQNYAIVSASGLAIPNNSGDIRSDIINETAT